MAQRVAVLGILNKRNGIVQNVTLRPGQSVRWKDVIVRLRACEKTAPWEPEELTGAFVQVDVHQPDKSWKRVFSGWLYKESPSLNVVEHPVYDVWPKSCEMTYPAGPPAPAAPASSSNLSSALKSGGASGARPSPSTAAPAPASPTPAPPPPSAAESNAT
jgi:pyruvate/2-oxoglutarate dehydrogenase complex dihydrolipoamide acyltransferase (E2) component